MQVRGQRGREGEREGGRGGGRDGSSYLMKAGRRRSVVPGSPAVAQAEWREGGR